LLVRNGGLVKTRRFGEDKYVGDPINAVRIFNEKEADELIVLDIDASAQSREPDYKMIEHLAAECRMPLCYGGGVRSADQARRIMSLGVEKVAVSSAIVRRPSLVQRSGSSGAKRRGVLDVKPLPEGVQRIRPTVRGYGADPIEFAQVESLGIGELV
jgi:cyclase